MRNLFDWIFLGFALSAVVVLIVVSQLYITRLGTTQVESLGLFSIEFLFEGDVPQTVRNAFTQAGRDWEQVFTSSLSTVATLQGNWCGVSFIGPRTVSGLLIAVYVRPIDAVGQVLAQAGPCAIDAQGFVRFGVVTMDSFDLTYVNPYAVARHEIGHVLGIGTLWAMFGGYYDESTYQYLKPEGLRGYAELGGEQGDMLRVENDGGSGTRFAHWEEDLFDAELMTGFVEESGYMPISRISVGALQDLGYPVSTERAETFALPSRRRLRDSKIHVFTQVKNCTGTGYEIRVVEAKSRG